MKILMIGPNPQASGGISAVQHVMLDHQHLTEIQYHHITTHIDGTMTKKIGVYFLSLWKIMIYVIHSKPDLVHIHFASRGSAARKTGVMLLLILLHKPFILHAHGGEFHLFFSSLPPIFKSMLRAAFNKSSLLIVLSKSWKEFYSSHQLCHPDKIKVIYNPVRIPERSSTRKGSSRPFIQFVFMGKISKSKGVFDLINAIAQIPSPLLTHCVFSFAGDGALPQLQKQISQYHLESNCRVWGWLNGIEKQRLLESGDVFLLPSYNEGVPMALLEAMAYGMAVITTPVGGIPELIEMHVNGVLVTPGDIHGLTNAIIFMIENQEMRCALKEAAEKTVRSYSAEKYMKRLESIYQQV